MRLPNVTYSQHDVLARLKVESAPGAERVANDEVGSYHGGSPSRDIPKVGSSLKVVVNDDGTRKVTFRQSWLNTFQHCPEQARLDMLGQLPRRESDATAMGTAVHSGIEEILLGGSDADGIAAAYDKFDELSALENFDWVQVKTLDTAQRTIFNALWGWYDHVYPQLGTPITIEHNFKVQIGSHNYTEIWLSGTWDFEDEGGLWDWKTAGREYERWEVERWHVQPTAYTLAHSLINDCEPVDFNYSISVKSGANKSRMQVIPVRRHQGHYNWLIHQCIQALKLYDATEQGHESWPLMDQGWTCSPKWCTNWMNCKGKYLGPNPW